MMRWLPAVLLVCILLSGASGEASPFQDPKGKVDQKLIDRAIDRGAAYLLAQNNKQPLVLLTLIHAQIDPKRFEGHISRAMTMELNRTYDVALIAMSIGELWRKEKDPDRKDEYFKRLVQCAQFLVDNQTSNGQWRYGTPVPLEEPEEEAEGTPTESAGPKSGDTRAEKDTRRGRKKKGPGRTEFRIRVRRRAYGTDGDNSNSQYAALGLRACHDAGIEIPSEVIDLAIDWWKLSQASGGGWGYCGSGTITPNGYGSMTVGAVGAYAIYLNIKGYPMKLIQKDPVITRGLKWIERNFTVQENPLHGDPPKHHYYYLYGMERAGMLLSTEIFGRHEWYPPGARYLIRNQAGDGSWDRSGRPVIETCFAILFLRRSTRPLDVATEGGSK